MVAKRASTSTISSSAPSSSQASSVPGETPAADSNRRMVLRIKSGEGARNYIRRVTLSSELDRKLTVTKSITKNKQKKKLDKVDTKMPKKPPTAFFFYLEDFRKDFQEQNPDVKSMREVGKACGEKWKTMTYEEKVEYYDIATQKRAEFDSAMKDYTKKKESGGLEDSDDDSEDYY